LAFSEASIARCKARSVCSFSAKAASSSPRHLACSAARSLRAFASFGLYRERFLQTLDLLLGLCLRRLHLLDPCLQPELFDEEFCSSNVFAA